MSAAKRRQLRGAIGSEVEELVAAYSSLAWYGHLERVRERLPTAEGALRDVVLIRLANELDDHLDLSPLYTQPAAQVRADLARNAPVCLEIARELGLEQLVAALARAFEEVRSREPSEAVRPRLRFLPGARVHHHDLGSSSFVVPPLSYRLRARLVPRRLLRRSAWLRRLYRALARP
jgi:hypothetical protein